MSPDCIELPSASNLVATDPFSEKKILRLLDSALGCDWAGVNQGPKSHTPDGQAFMLKKNDDGFWHVSEIYRGSHELLAAFSFLPDAAKFFYITVTGEDASPEFK